MSDSTTPEIPAGWYPDPAGGPRPRWWDGTAWTEHYADLPAATPAVQAPAAPVAPVVPAASSAPETPAAPYGSEPSAAPGFTSGAPAVTNYPAAAPYSADSGVLTAPAGTPTNTPWIWLLIFLPLIGFLPILFVDWNSFIDASLGDPNTALEAQFALYTSPAMVGTYVGSFLVVVLSILFAFLDWRSLKKAGVPQPFHFLWVLFMLVIGTSAVYSIGRAVVVKRRTGSGLAPMWATIGVLVLMLILGIVVVVAVSAAFFSAIPGAF